ncbi:MAG: chemotaxis protein CheW [Halobacteriovoraceae bacterium]|nr:chemotaxis protein CheW [Halobacteriovoraceae bacterium]MBC98340.1 chemotaxis protein CheW [Halobacteriovoraceae bacterium]|tara:strand:+ start:9894 stop:10373 length:480 start_codon:yes stop_codon:yes gene_type:complete
MDERHDVIEAVLSGDTSQLCGFKIMDGQYAIPVLEVQEVVKPQKVTPVPLGPDYVDGLINLRGQIVTAINLRVLFGLPRNEDENQDYMNIIVRWGDGLYALVVDEIMDVMDIENTTFEETPDMIEEDIKKYIRGVFKLENELLSLLSLEMLLDIKSPNN